MKVKQFVTTSAIFQFVTDKFNATEVVRWVVMKNGAIQVTYKVNDRKCSTFIGQNTIAKAVVKVMAQRAKEVKLTDRKGSDGFYRVVGDNGFAKYVTSVAYCSCPSYARNQMRYALGHSICKHTIAVASRNGINSLNQLSRYILGI